MDLLRHTSGIDYRGPRDAEGKWIYEKIGTNSLDQTVGDMVKKISQAPLVHQPALPGNTPVDGCVARLVEVVSGKPYDKFLEERTLQTLGMIDTEATPSGRKANRFSKLYAPPAKGR